MNTSLANNFLEDIPNSVSPADLDALLEDELALVDENAEIGPENESEVIKSSTLPAPMFEEFDGVMAELLASSVSMFQGQSPVLEEVVEVQSTEDVLPVPIVLTQIEVQDIGLKDLQEDERLILLQLMDLIVESVEFSNPVVTITANAPTVVETVDCNLKIFEENVSNPVETESVGSSVSIVPLDSELLRLQEMAENLIKNEEVLGQTAISQVEEELLREQEKIAERNRKREKQRLLALRNAKAVSTSLLM